MLYKIDTDLGATETLQAACADQGDTGLDCYEPEFFYPKDVWEAKHYRAELTITQNMLDTSHGGVIYYFCHIHSKMSGKIILQNADGSAATKADGSALDNPTEQTLYSPSTISDFDYACGTHDTSDYEPGGTAPSAGECAGSYLCGTLDTPFEKCMNA